PVIVARDRSAGAKAIPELAGGSTVLILDDGLQNPSLVKDLTFAVVDGRRGLGNGGVIPAGPLRAPLDVQLRLADAIVVNDGTRARPSEWIDRLKQKFHGPVLFAETEPFGDVAWVAGARIVAFAGIGAPQRFFALLQRLGAAWVERAAFPDHHPFSERDAERLLAMAREKTAILATTEKDWVRLQGAGGLRAQLRNMARPVAIALNFEPREADRFSSLVGTALTGK
ncbi:MAG: tetraacyldisaccharide 4'-kinase, partial [Hyphomicrobiaceae bacterium]